MTEGSIRPSRVWRLPVEEGRSRRVWRRGCSLRPSEVLLDGAQGSRARVRMSVPAAAAPVTRTSVRSDASMATSVPVPISVLGQAWRVRGQSLTPVADHRDDVPSACTCGSLRLFRWHDLGDTSSMPTSAATAAGGRLLSPSAGQAQPDALSEATASAAWPDVFGTTKIAVARRPAGGRSRLPPLSAASRGVASAPGELQAPTRPAVAGARRPARGPPTMPSTPSPSRLLTPSSPGGIGPRRAFRDRLAARVARRLLDHRRVAGPGRVRPGGAAATLYFDQAHLPW